MQSRRWNRWNKYISWAINGKSNSNIDDNHSADVDDGPLFHVKQCGRCVRTHRITKALFDLWSWGNIALTGNLIYLLPKSLNNSYEVLYVKYTCKVFIIFIFTKTELLYNVRAVRSLSL